MAEWKFIGARRYECSACGEGIPDMPCDWNNGEPLYNFCPYCGANMTMKKADGRYEPRGDDIIVRSNLEPFRVVEADRKDEPQVVMPKKCKGCDSTSKIIEAYSRGFEDGAEAVKAMPQTERSE